MDTKVEKLHVIKSINRNTDYPWLIVTNSGSVTCRHETQLEAFLCASEHKCGRFHDD